MKIKNSDISFVLQGAYTKETYKSIKMLEKVYKGCEIILSTWEGTKIDEKIEKKVDKIVFSKDPGGIWDEKIKLWNNVNRQIISSKNGIQASTKKFVMKLRTDMTFKTKSFLKFYCKFYNLKVENEFKIFKQRVLIFNSLLCKKNPWDFGESLLFFPIIFHFNDWIQFGLRDDVFRIWNINLFDGKSNFWNTDYFEKNIFIETKMFETSFSMAPETFIFSNLLSNKKEFKSIADASNDLIKKSKRILVNNFLVLDTYNSGSKFYKKIYSKNTKIINGIKKDLFESYVMSSYSFLLEIFKSTKGIPIKLKFQNFLKKIILNIHKLKKTMVL